jgi:hypothetical protein
MRKLYIFALLFGFSAFSHAEIIEKPIKLENQGSQENPDQIYFPPATEPYKPVPVQQPVSPSVDQFKRMEQQQGQQYQQSVMQQPSQPAFANVPVTNYAVTAVGTTREMLDRAAASCDAELAELWKQKSSVNPARMAEFQKCVGEAKVRCDKLKESATEFKRADHHLTNYQSSIQKAQSAMN